MVRMNRCLIPRLSVSVGDRVQEEIVRKADYNPADVDKILAAERGRKKVRHRTDDDEDTDGEAETPPTASVTQPPKRRKYKPKKHVQNKPRMMPEERRSNDIVDSDSTEKKPSSDQQEPINVQNNLRMEGPDSNSDQKYFPLFSRNIVRSEVKREKDRPRKSKQTKIIPPTFNYNKISDHFSKLPNDQRDDEKRGRGS